MIDLLEAYGDSSSRGIRLALRPLPLSRPSGVHRAHVTSLIAEAQPARGRRVPRRLAARGPRRRPVPPPAAEDRGCPSSSVKAGWDSVVGAVERSPSPMSVWLAGPDERPRSRGCSGSSATGSPGSAPPEEEILASVERIMAAGGGDYLLGAPGDGEPLGVCQLRFRWSVWKSAEDAWRRGPVRAPGGAQDWAGAAPWSMRRSTARASAPASGWSSTCRRTTPRRSRSDEACGFQLTPKGSSRTLFISRMLDPVQLPCLWTRAQPAPRRRDRGGRVRRRLRRHLVRRLGAGQGRRAARGGRRSAARRGSGRERLGGPRRPPDLHPLR